MGILVVSREFSWTERKGRFWPTYEVCRVTPVLSMKKKYLLGAAGALALAFAVVLFVLPGKKTRPDAVTPDGTKVQIQLIRIANFYRLFLDTKGRSPVSFEELVQLSREFHDEIKEESLILPRDKQRMVILYRVARSAPGKQDPIVAHEQSGFGGRRFVVFLDSNRVTELTEAEFRKNMQN
jgi:hypothetical protein